ncbi:MAG: hypothetical protein ACUVWP_02580 [bacterium]
MRINYFILIVLIPVYIASYNAPNYRYAGLVKEEVPSFSGFKQVYLHSLNIFISEREYPGFVFITDRVNLFRKAFINIDDVLSDTPLVFLTDRGVNQKRLSLNGRECRFAFNWLDTDLSSVRYEPFLFTLSGQTLIALYNGGPEVRFEDNSLVKFENIPVKVEEPISGIFLSDGNFNTERYRFFADFSIPHINASMSGERNLTSGFGRFPDTSYGSLTVSSIIYSNWFRLPIDFIYSGGDVDRFQLNKIDIGYRFISLEPQFNPSGSVSPFARFSGLYGRNMNIDNLYNIGSGIRFRSDSILTFIPSTDIVSNNGDRKYNFSGEFLLRDVNRYLLSSGFSFISGGNKKFTGRLSGSISMNRYFVPFLSYRFDIWSNGGEKEHDIIGGMRLYLPNRGWFQVFLNKLDILQQKGISFGGLASIDLLWGFNIYSSWFYNFRTLLDVPSYLITTNFGCEREVINGIVPSVYFKIQNVGGVIHSQDLLRNGYYKTKPYMNTSLKGAIKIKTIELFACVGNIFDRQILDGGCLYPPEPRNYQFGIFWILSD